MSALGRRAEKPRQLTVATRSVARSHVGLVRRINEDRTFERPDIGLWAVIDGMGGHRGGDQAAQTVVDALRTLKAPSGVEAVLDAANAQINARNLRQGEQAGATVVAMSRDGDTMRIIWAGDSRCYRVRAGRAEQLTSDHSVVQELVDAGLLTSQAAASHPHANVITRALGVDPACRLDSVAVALSEGDRFLLCSDGLSRSLAEADLHGAGLEVTADALLAGALARDGSDNISFVLVDAVAT